MLSRFPAFRDRDAACWEARIAPDFPDIEHPILQVVADGDRVLVQRRPVATHSGECENTLATGARTDIVVMDLFRAADGTLAERWAQMDNLTLPERIGAVDA